MEHVDPVTGLKTEGKMLHDLQRIFYMKVNDGTVSDIDYVEFDNAIDQHNLACTQKAKEYFSNMNVPDYVDFVGDPIVREWRKRQPGMEPPQY